MRAQTTNTGPYLALLAACVFAGTLLSRARTLWPFTVDDTFITLHYAKHLAHGEGPVWNVGGPLVEGYTTVLWMALLTLPEALGLSGPLVAKLASTCCALGAIALSGLLAYLLTGPNEGCDRRARWLSAVAPALAASAYWKLAVHAVSGMETMLTSCLLTALFCLLVRFARQPQLGAARAAALLALASTLARPELAVAAGAGLLSTWLQAGPVPRALLLRSVLWFTIAPGLAYFLTRYALFGLLFPLPFYVKATGQATLSGSEDVARFFLGFARHRPDILALAVVAVVLRRRLALPVLVGSLALAVFFLFPAHIMGFEERYLMPILPPLLSLAGAGSGELLWRALTSAPRAAHALHALTVGLWLVGAALPFPHGRAEAEARWVAYGRGLSRAHEALAHTLRALRPHVSRPVVALLDVGAVAYYSDWYVVDTFGLNEARVALSRRSDVVHVFSYRPELVVLVSGAPDRFAPLFDWEVPLHAEALRRGFRPLTSYTFLPDYHLRVLAREGSPLLARTKEKTLPPAEWQPWGGGQRHVGDARGSLPPTTTRSWRGPQAQLPGELSPL